MPEQKTPIQTAIEELQVSEKEATTYLRKSALKDAIDTLKRYLPKEKRQIELAYTAGLVDGGHDEVDNDYFKENFIEAR